MQYFTRLLKGALMPFADDFAACMSGAGISIDAGSIPDADTLGAAIAYARQYQQSLDPDIAAALDDATRDDYTATILSHSDINVIDSGYNSLLQAFDAASGMPLSTCLEWCEYCVQQARDAAAANPESQG
jgi:hypothetical protein